MAVFKDLKSIKPRQFWKNGFEGILSNVLQNIFYSLFFILLIRHYDKTNIGYYLISNVLYSTISSLSGLGIGAAYIRKYKQTENANESLNEFTATLLFSGLIMFLLNTMLSFLLYSHSLIHLLSLIFSCHIILDNALYVFRYHHFALDKQRITYRIAVLDPILKCSVGLSLFFISIPVLSLLTIITIIRLLMVAGVWLTYMPSRSLKIMVNMKKGILGIIHRNIFQNWKFIAISALAILNWRTGSFVISTSMGPESVTAYEVAFKLLSLAYMIPVVFCNSLYPMFVQFNHQPQNSMTLYRKSLLFLVCYGLLCFTFMNTYAEEIIFFLFGDGHQVSAIYTKQIFMIMIPYPVVLLQAGFLISKGFESVDLQGNIIVFGFTLLLSLAGLSIFHGVMAVIYALVLSFALFMIYQDIVLCKIESKWKKELAVKYIFLLFIPLIYLMLNYMFATKYLFLLFWVGILSFLFFFYRKNISVYFLRATVQSSV